MARRKRYSTKNKNTNNNHLTVKNVINIHEKKTRKRKSRSKSDPQPKQGVSSVNVQVAPPQIQNIYNQPKGYDLQPIQERHEIMHRPHVSFATATQSETHRSEILTASPLFGSEPNIQPATPTPIFTHPRSIKKSVSRIGPIIEEPDDSDDSNNTLNINRIRGRQIKKQPEDAPMIDRMFFSAINHSNNDVYNDENKKGFDDALKDDKKDEKKVPDFNDPNIHDTSQPTTGKRGPYNTKAKAETFSKEIRDDISNIHTDLNNINSKDFLKSVCDIVGIDKAVVSRLSTKQLSAKIKNELFNNTDSIPKVKRLVKKKIKSITLPT